MSTDLRNRDRPAYAAAAPTRSEADRFAEAMRPREMGPRLAAAVGSGRTCHVLDAKYEPGVRATLLYEHAGRLLRGDLLPRWPAAPDPGDAVVVAPGVRVACFPHDPELPSLGLVSDGDRLAPVLADALSGTAPGDTPRPRARCRTSLLRYRPGKRATVRVRFVGSADTYVAKAYNDPRKAAAVAAEAPGLADHADRCAVLRVPATVAHLRAHGVVVQRAVGGLPLEALLGRSLTSAGGVRTATEAMWRTGRALAELHGMPPAIGRRRSVDDELTRFGARAARITGPDPRLGHALAELAGRLRETQPACDPVPGTVHGDCKPSQVLLDGPHVLLLDPDHLGVSDQAVDVGTFLASLRQLPLRTNRGRSARSGALSALATTFLQSYLETRGDDADLPRIRWQEAVALERKALRAWARAPGSPMVVALVREANTCLDRLTERP